MGKPNTRQLDQMIRATESKLKRVRAGEISALAGGEQARVLLHVGRGARRVMRGKSTSSADRAIDRIFAAAESRYAAELQAAQTARQTVISQAAADKVAKKTESKWW
ncbi:hypothetical protein [Streptomyces sp. NPDC056227]|uniref:hypothetical protein n=1 Tax=Streptomyces sp. NPDC056227 TaxID=3345753 RepID=UPI0035D57ABC